MCKKFHQDNFTGLQVYVLQKLIEGATYKWYVWFVVCENKCSVVIFQKKEHPYIISTFMMECFYGSWKFVSCENFDDYLKGHQKLK